MVRRLSAGYRGRPVLNDVSFELTSGRMLAVLGPNGSGKSTLLKALIDSVEVNHGEVSADGIDWLRVSPTVRAKQVAFVPQSEPPIFPFPVRDVVLMGRLPHQPGFFDDPKDLDVAESAMREADIHDLAERAVTDLSGGELQRVWLARALAQQTPAILLDEPTAHLDARHVVAFVASMRRLKAQGKLLIGVFHDLNLACEVADEFLLLREGQVAARGPMPALRDADLLREVYGTAFNVQPDWLWPKL